ncbi:MAG: hypothetical protein H0U47_02855 [Nocardioidaceae bacterium]|nr:hypothetical protein [Nocardioidaceae bacterium]
MLTAAAVGLMLAGANVAIWNVSTEQPQEPSSISTAVDPDAEPSPAVDNSAIPDRPGTYVQTQLLSNGRLRSDEYIVTREPTDTVTLRVRPLSGYDGIAPVVQRLEVFADGSRVAPARPRVSGTDVRTVTLSEPSTRVHLRYVTSRGVLESAPSETGRALVLANPLSAVVEVPVRPRWVQLTGADVLSLSCVVGEQTPQPCGGPDDVGAGWRVELPRAGVSPGVLAQVDLPAA